MIRIMSCQIISSDVMSCCAVHTSSEESDRKRCHGILGSRFIVRLSEFTQRCPVLHNCRHDNRLLLQIKDIWLSCVWSLESMVPVLITDCACVQYTVAVMVWLTSVTFSLCPYTHV